MPSELSGKRVLVTGGTGFIGGRVVERLVECGATVRVLLRNYVRALRIARYPVEFVVGEVTSAPEVERAVHGCQAVVHCAYGNSGADDLKRVVNVEGTRNVIQAALHHRVERFVHLSTVQVYGRLRSGDLDETMPRRYFGDSYSDSKLDAETLVSDGVRASGLPAVIIQPTVVYGPYSPSWTAGILTKLKTGRQILVNGGDGFCNAVYIDDVASAILLALVQEKALGEAFLVSAEAPVTWRAFFGHYERMLGTPATVTMSAAEAARWGRPVGLAGTLAVLVRDESLRRQLSNARELAALRRLAQRLPPPVRRSIKRVLQRGGGSPSAAAATGDGAKPIVPLRYPLDANFYAAKAHVRIDKARRLLGYVPRFDLDTGMKRTEQWAGWANLL